MPVEFVIEKEVIVKPRCMLGRMHDALYGGAAARWKRARGKAVCYVREGEYATILPYQ